MVTARMGGLGRVWRWGPTAQADLRAGNYGITFLFASRRASWKRHEVLNSQSPEFLRAVSGGWNPEKGAGYRTKLSASNSASPAKQSGPAEPRLREVALLLQHF